MRKFILIFALMLAYTDFAQAQNNEKKAIPPYDDLRMSAINAYQNRDNETAYSILCMMDSVYGITSNDCISLMYLLFTTHICNPGSEAEKTVFFRAAESKWFDMRYLDEEAEVFKTDTLDYWDEIVNMVSPRGYQDTVYQNRLMAMWRARYAPHQLQFNSNYDQDSLARVIKTVDSLNYIELRQLIEERGFPTLTRVGAQCNDMATYIVQFMPDEFFDAYLIQALSAADSGDYNPEVIRAMADSRDLTRKDLNEAYRKELKAMCEEDQRLRHLLDDMTDLESDSLWREIHLVDSLNIKHLEELIAQYGFPTYRNVGHTGIDHASLLAQHGDPEFLHWYLDQALLEADKGDFDKTWIAYMTDRDLTHNGKPQLYGTQLLTIDDFTAFEPIADIGNLDERRNEMGLGSIEPYMKSYELTDLVIHPYLVDYNQYFMRIRIEGDTLKVEGTCYFSYKYKRKHSMLLSKNVRIDSFGEGMYHRKGKRIRLSGHPISIKFSYSMPLSNCRADDGTIVLQSGDSWYPHRKGELLTANVKLESNAYHLEGGNINEPTKSFQTVLLPL